MDFAALVAELSAMNSSVKTLTKAMNSTVSAMNSFVLHRRHFTNILFGIGDANLIIHVIHIFFLILAIAYLLHSCAIHFATVSSTTAGVSGLIVLPWATPRVLVINSDASPFTISLT